MAAGPGSLRSAAPWTGSASSYESSEKPKKRKTKQSKPPSTPISFAKFDINKLNDNAKICIYGKRGSGKSWIIRKLLQTLNRSQLFLQNTLIISIKEPYENFYTKNFPQSQIQTIYNPISIGNSLYNNGCIVLDDCLASKPSYPELAGLMSDMNYNHKSFILGMQFVSNTTNSLTENADYIFLLREDFLANQIIYWKHYGGMFPTFEMFKEAFNALTQNYDCMVIDMKAHGKPITDKIFYFNAVNEHEITIPKIMVKKPTSEFKEFNMSNLGYIHTNICIFGKRGSGKKELCEKIINKIVDPVNLIISSKDNPFHCNTYPQAQKEYDFNDEIIEKYLENKNEGCVVLDKCIVGETTQTESLTKLLFNGRHYNKSSIIIMQYPLGLSPEIRSNFTFIFIFYDNCEQNQKRYYNHYANIFPTFDSFKLAFEQGTKNGGCMVIDNRKGPTTLDCISYFNLNE